MFLCHPARGKHRKSQANHCIWASEYIQLECYNKKVPLLLGVVLKQCELLQSTSQIHPISNPSIANFEMEQNLLAGLALDVISAFRVQRVVGRIAGTVEGTAGIAESEGTTIGAANGFAGNAKVFNQVFVSKRNNKPVLNSMRALKKENAP